MKAIVFSNYGSPEVLEIQDVEKPTPTDDEVLVKVRATSVNPVEWYAMTGLFLTRLGNGLFKPKETRLGVDFAGLSKPQARTSQASNLGMKSSAPAAGPLLNTCAFRTWSFPNPPTLPSNRPEQLRLLRSPHCRVSASMASYKRDKKS